MWDIVAGQELPAGAAIATSTTGSSSVGGDGGDTAWKKKDRKAFILVTSLVADSQLGLVRACKTSKEVWDKLAKTYEASTSC